MKTKILLLLLLSSLFLNARAGEAASASAEAAGGDSSQQIPEEVRSKLTHNIGSAFLVFRAKVQEELKATPEQRAKLDEVLRGLLPDAMQVLQRGKEEKEKFHQRAHEVLVPILAKILREEQQTRLHQLERQRDGLFGPEWNMKELQISEEQRRSFMGPIQETQTKTKALMGEIQKGADPEVMRPKILQLRLDLEVKLEGLLTDAQRNQWQEMRGAPADLGALFDGVAGR